ncbi:arabinogalactan endo-beta-1,4-galactanase [Amorphoplanes digitatis]|uniref:Arabinogalactan endo-beta-1,4-galactanase n=1 Tax=Actinoplanes digitatis TaxID=1868 RepID=A0A7W7MQX5_9ACTN|nr:arabinogalactan endo-1,4-beta-galactosidase [Actinoplanes digitatis]MBB4763658.1 arabinogalactan endo-1,4-beta-galactosidase [Actinoplanes digitatis]GID93084.1 arabinogalactan endo-beta-1,4-galactanase [Actinoplanes digitatis]
MLRTPPVLAAATAVAVLAVAPPAHAAAAGDVHNPGFEAGAAAVPAGWSESGARAASFTEAGGHTGAYQLTHYSDTAYRVETSQTVTGLSRGSHTLSLRVRSDGNQRDAYVSLRGCGSAEERAAIPRTGAEWVRLAVTARVTGGRCTIVLHSDAAAGQWTNFDDIALDATTGRPGTPLAITGADVSHVTKNEDHGAVYRDASGRRQDPLRLLAANNVGYIRLKVWVDPVDGYNNPADVLEKARRAHRAGQRLLIDFHYSDAWADPGKQIKPAAWAALSFDDLSRAVYDHTYAVLRDLRAQGTPAAMAQIGNEINGGMLWPDGRWDNWDGLAALLTSGANAVHAASPGTKVVLHLAEGGNLGGHQWWFDQATSRGVPFDVIAVSHYVYWHGSLGALQANLMNLSTRYGRPVMVAETAYGFTTAENDHETNIFNASLAQAGGYPATPRGQADALRDILTVVAGVPGALGVFYWEPTWTAADGAGWDPADPASGDGWENQALFDYQGRALPGLAVFRRF